MPSDRILRPLTLIPSILVSVGLVLWILAGWSFAYPETTVRWSFFMKLGNFLVFSALAAATFWNMPLFGVSRRASGRLRELGLGFGVAALLMGFGFLVDFVIL